ncbi:heme utilization protein HutZ [Vibrio panuliri]|uniref:Heme utilization protein HutZ n=1 Tax=Vibrio panuliri TaxID=1381081 RepID=A0A1Q9HJT0_9VIBR|nr:heme utilization protein HutZ [Vibrio panuliri]KAB1453898.1 heme utilization protein HutZ [Vibrio panuliri]OLQ83963.1 heme utilization protein HutZ [Vibrio panuliri]OLQ90556.1 heme utilization protein HutZ [Vibrio panuliri]
MNSDNKPTNRKSQEEAERRARLQSRLGEEVQQFRDSRQTLQLATIDAQGMANASYAPFAFDRQGYYILVSDIAAHGQNLKVNPNVSILMIEDETEAKQIYARKRLTFDTTAQLIERKSEQWHQGLAALDRRFGDIIASLSQLGDFNLYRLIPKSGRYVKGFGQAYDVSSDDLLDFVHLQQGHIFPAKGEQ